MKQNTNILKTIEQLGNNESAQKLKEQVEGLIKKIEELEKKSNKSVEQVDLAKGSFDGLALSFKSSLEDLLVIGKSIGIDSYLISDLKDSNNREKFYLDLKNNIDNLYNKELKSLSDSVDIKTSEEDFSSIEKKSELFGKISTSVIGLKNENLEYFKELGGLEAEKNKLEIEKGNLEIKIQDNLYEIDILNSEIEKKDEEIFLLKEKNKNLSEKILEIAKKLFPEKKISEENFDVIFEEILIKINELIDNQGKVAQAELDEKNEELCNANNLLNRIEGDNDSIKEKVRGLESSVKILIGVVNDLGEIRYSLSEELENANKRIIDLNLENEKIKKTLEGEQYDCAHAVNNVFILEIENEELRSKKLEDAKKYLENEMILESMISEFEDENIELSNELKGVLFKNLILIASNKDLQESLIEEIKKSEKNEDIIEVLQDKINKFFKEKSDLKIENFNLLYQIDINRADFESQLEEVYEKFERAILEGDLENKKEVSVYEKGLKNVEIFSEELIKKFGRSGEVISKIKFFKDKKIKELRSEIKRLKEERQVVIDENSELKAKITGFEKNEKDLLGLTDESEEFRLNIVKKLPF